MFGFKNKNNHDYWNNLYKEANDKYQAYYDWTGSEECNRMHHLQNLIIKTYETVNIKADILGRRLNESFTREDYLEDFKVFFKPEVFNKLREWCKEYEILRNKEVKLIEQE